VKSERITLVCTSLPLRRGARVSGNNLEDHDRGRLLFAAGSLHAEKVASRKGPVLSIAWSLGGMILAAAFSNQTVKPLGR
jgi:hypothetical protein